MAARRQHLAGLAAIAAAADKQSSAPAKSAVPPPVQSGENALDGQTLETASDLARVLADAVCMQCFFLIFFFF